MQQVLKLIKFVKLNINFMRNISEFLSKEVRNNIDIFLIDSQVPPNTLDRDSKGGRIKLEKIAHQILMNI